LTIHSTNSLNPNTVFVVLYGTLRNGYMYELTYNKFRQSNKCKQMLKIYSYFLVT